MHYITTRIWPILGVIMLLLSTNAAFSKGLSDDSVFYRATDGREDNVYVVGITRSYLDKFVNEKVRMWGAFQKCEQQKPITFVDPLFTSESVTFSVTNTCKMMVKTVFGIQECQGNPMAILYIQDYLKEDLRHGYGAEYLTRYERDYLDQYCKVISK